MKKPFATSSPLNNASGILIDDRNIWYGYFDRLFVSCLCACHSLTIKHHDTHIAVQNFLFTSNNKTVHKNSRSETFTLSRRDKLFQALLRFYLEKLKENEFCELWLHLRYAHASTTCTRRMISTYAPHSRKIRRVRPCHPQLIAHIGYIRRTNACERRCSRVRMCARAPATTNYTAHWGCVCKA